MTSVKPKQLRSEIKSGKILNRYIFTGEEEGEKEKIITEIRSQISADPEMSRISTGIFHAENDEIIQAAEFVLSPSMFSPRLLCVVKNIESLKQNRKVLSVVEDMAVHCPESVTLILTTGKNRPPAFLKKDILSLFRQVQFWRYFENDLSKYLRDSLNRLGIPAGMDAVEQILEYTGRDIKKIDDAVERLRDSGIEGGISSQDIKFLIEDTRDSSVFDFAESLFAKNHRSLATLQRILEEKRVNELALLGVIQRQAELIEKFHSLVDEGADMNTAVKSCGIFESKKSDFLRSAEKQDSESLKKIFTLISETDRKLKSGTRGKSLVNNPLFYLTSEILIHCGDD